MILFFSVLIFLIIFALAFLGIVSTDVFVSPKMKNHETPVDSVKFTKCVLPFNK